MRFVTLAATAAVLAAPALAHGNHGGLATQYQNKPTAGAIPAKGRQWLPGDHHIHSEYSANYETDPKSPQTAPIPLLGKDGRYAIVKNAQMARQFGLHWMVSTDHGGPNHSKLNYSQAWPAVNEARGAVPEMLIFYGMEFTGIPGIDLLRWFFTPCRCIHPKEWRPSDIHMTCIQQLRKVLIEQGEQ
jgi:hypothetical protein